MDYKGMKKPCDTCYISVCTYYEYPCSDCTHNPLTDGEIEEEIKTTLNPESREDLYKHYKK